MSQLEHLLSCDNNLDVFNFWWRETVIKLKKSTNVFLSKIGTASSVYNQWQNIMGILKIMFKNPPLPLYNVANP